MRESLFRGWNEELKKWVYGCGCGVTKEGVSYIVTNVEAPNKSRLNDVYANAVSVNSESIGQFIGLIDKNGVKIFEGDVVNHYTYNDINPVKKEIIFSDGSFHAFSKLNNVIVSNKTSMANFAPIRTFEVIGNIFENKKLLND